MSDLGISMEKQATQNKSEDNYQRIWKTVQLIPIGKVACYGQIADLAGLPGRARLVGKALSNIGSKGYQGKVVPWFRVINSQGRISFSKGSDGFNKQKLALENESVVINGNKIDLKCYQWQPELSEILFGLEY